MPTIDGVRVPRGRTLCRVCRATMLPADANPPVCRFCARRLLETSTLEPYQRELLDRVLDGRPMVLATPRKGAGRGL